MKIEMINNNVWKVTYGNGFFDIVKDRRYILALAEKHGVKIG